MMRYPDLIKKAWHLTVDHKYLINIGILSSVFALLIGFVRVRYILPTPTGTVMDVYEFLQNNTNNPIIYATIVIILYGIIYIAAMFTNVLADGALISGIAKIESQKIRLSFGKCISLGLHAFLPLVEFKVVTSLLNIGNFIMYILLIRFYVRYYSITYGGGESDILSSFYPILIVAAILIAVISVFLTYGEYNLVIHRAGIFKSIKRSITLVIFHMSETILITVLVVLITIRALINILLIFLVPGIIVVLVEYLSLKVSLTISISIGAFIAVAIFWFAVKIAGTLNAFTTAVWTLTFLELDQRKEHKVLTSEEDDTEFE